MAFWGDYFIFDGIPCTEYGLRLYEVNGVSPGNGSFPSPAEISEDRISGRYKPLFYGITQNEPLTFKMVFGADKSFVKTNGFLMPGIGRQSAHGCLPSMVISGWRLSRPIWSKFDIGA